MPLSLCNKDHDKDRRDRLRDRDRDRGRDRFHVADNQSTDDEADNESAAESSSSSGYDCLAESDIARPKVNLSEVLSDLRTTDSRRRYVKVCVNMLVKKEAQYRHN